MSNETNSKDVSAEDKLMSLLHSPQITPESLKAVDEVLKLIMVLSPAVRLKVEAFILSNTLYRLPDSRGGSVACFVDSLPKELYCKVLVDLTAARSLNNFNWLKHALASENVLTSDEWERLLLKPIVLDWSTVENLVTELCEAQKTKMLAIVSQFQITNLNSTDEEQLKLLEETLLVGLGKAPMMPKTKRRTCQQQQQLYNSKGPIFFSRKVTPGGSVIHVFQGSGKRKSGSKPPTQQPSLSERCAICYRRKSLDCCPASEDE